jgi:ApaG protein
MGQQSLALNGLKVTLDKLEYNYGSFGTSDETPHIFVYYLTIWNHSDRRVKLLGRKWIFLKTRPG